MSKMSFLKKLIHGDLARTLRGQTIPQLEVANFQGLGKRSRQEDSFLVGNLDDPDTLMERGFVACVADGMGGLSDGDQASAMVTSSMFVYHRAANRYVYEEGYWVNCVDSMVLEAEIMKEHSQSDFGSTMVAAIVYRDKLYFASVGDSRIYLVRDGQMYQLNEEHNLGNKLLHRVVDGVLDMEDYEDTTGKAGLTSYIGGPKVDLRDISYAPIQLMEGDTILLLSDGVFGTLPEEQIREIVLQEDCIHAAKRMQDEIERIGKAKQDNYTGIIIRYVGEK